MTIASAEHSTLLHLCVSKRWCQHGPFTGPRRSQRPCMKHM